MFRRRSRRVSLDISYSLWVGSIFVPTHVLSPWHVLYVLAAGLISHCELPKNEPSTINPVPVMHLLTAIIGHRVVITELAEEQSLQLIWLLLLPLA